MIDKKLEDKDYATYRKDKWKISEGRKIRNENRKEEEKIGKEEKKEKDQWKISEGRKIRNKNGKEEEKKENDKWKLSERR